MILLWKKNVITVIIKKYVTIDQSESSIPESAA